LSKLKQSNELTSILLCYYNPKFHAVITTVSAVHEVPINDNRAFSSANQCVS